MHRYIVDTAALRNNVKVLRKRAGNSAFWAVIKGDGYGLGLLPMARLLRDCGVARFAVTEPADVQAMRDAGMTDCEILVLRPTADPNEVQLLLSLNAILTVSSQDDAAVISGVAGRMGVRAKAHLKIDTGMGRYGFLPTEIDKIRPICTLTENLEITGIYSHFHSAFCNKRQTVAQFEAFKSVLDALKEANIAYGMAHICNSAGLLRFPEYKLDGVRVGSALLGRLSFKGSFGLKKVGYCEATVDELRWLPAGHSTGYGAGWRAKKPTRIAVLPVGYFHGFGCAVGDDIFRARDEVRKIFGACKRLIFKKYFHVTVNGKKCRVLGHIGMLHTVIDVTKCDCKLGDMAVLNINPILLRGMDIVYKE